MSIKPKIARATRANAGLTLKYRRQMLALVDEMTRSTEFWMTAAYRAAPPRLAQDKSPFREMQKRLREIAKRWQKRFDEAAPLIAEAYVKGQFAASESSMLQALKDVGWAVEFKMTPAVRDAYNASLAENISLIKSIPQQYLLQVEGIYARSYSQGRDLATTITQLRELYPMTRNRAVVIARDQGHKANAVITRARDLELGIKKGIWMHSHAGRTPRKSHMAMNGKIYDIETGMWDSVAKRFIQPGELINCKCTSRPVLPF